MLLITDWFRGNAGCTQLNAKIMHSLNVYSLSWVLLHNRSHSYRDLRQQILFTWFRKHIRIYLQYKELPVQMVCTPQVLINTTNFLSYDNVLIDIPTKSMWE